jgi:hypothetical protein
MCTVVCYGHVSAATSTGGGASPVSVAFMLANVVILALRYVAWPVLRFAVRYVVWPILLGLAFLAMRAGIATGAEVRRRHRARERSRRVRYSPLGPVRAQALARPGVPAIEAGARMPLGTAVRTAQRVG